MRDNYVIHYIQKGKGTFSSANHPSVSLKAGDVFILPKGVPCFYQADGKDPWSYFWLGLSGIKIKAMLSGSILASKNYLRQVQGSQFYQSLQKLFDAAHSPSSLTNDILIEALLYFTFYNLNIEYPVKKRKNSKIKDDQLKTATTYLRQNFSNSSLSIIDLCNKLDLSRSYLYILFKNNMGLSPQQFLINLRMEQAKEYLTDTEKIFKKLQEWWDIMMNSSFLKHSSAIVALVQNCIGKIYTIILNNKKDDCPTKQSSFSSIQISN